ncbi:MAG TPA: D-aminoacylase [Gemmatimonadales bacterium]|nr:D-aminoacylase [Gemmatimonadales bacterium]
MRPLPLALLGAVAAFAGCRPAPAYDLVIRHGTVYDGSGGEGRVADVAVVGDSIVAVGDLGTGRGRVEVDATGLAVAPGFINMLSWANTNLIADGRSQGDLRQGVTLEIFGEGASMGPLTDSMRAEMIARQGDFKYDIPWTTLGEYLDYLVTKGVSTNVASFVGATTVRVHEVGYTNRAATPAELARMQDLVRQGMAEGALGVGSALIYAPANYASTEELTALASAAGESGGMYISHMRDEGRGLLTATRELITIASRAGVPAEIYHLKASGRPNWAKLDSLLALIDSARAAGLRITADMYTYPASSTGLDATMPTWVQEGGHDAWVQRLKDPAIRKRLLVEMQGVQGFDNAFVNAGGAEGILLVSFKNPALKPLTGKTLAEVARMRGTSPEETAMDLVIEDDSRVGCVFFTMSEDNLRREVQLPYMSFGSDGGSMSAEGVFLLSGTHPRAYGNFARLLGKYVREEQLVTLPEAIRRLTSLPADNLKLVRRGRLAPGAFADIVVFDPATIADRATFDQPHQYATGVLQVWVNGVQVLRNGEPTGAMPGRVVRGPGYRAPD